MRLAGLEIGRQRARAQCGKAFGNIGIVQDLGGDTERLHASVLGVRPLAIAARHPQDAVLVKVRSGILESGKRTPVPVGIDSVTREQERLVDRIAHAANG